MVAMFKYAIPNPDLTESLLQIFAPQVALEIERNHHLTELNKLSQALEQSPNVTFITDTEGVIVYVNSAFEKLSGYSKIEAIGKKPNLLKSGKMPDEYYQDLWVTLKAGKIWKNDVCNKKKDGTLYWSSINASPIFDHQGNITHYLAIEKDLTNRIKNEQKIRYQSNHDLLTGLPNRNLGIDRLNQCLKVSRTNSTITSVICVGIDNFKIINEKYGLQLSDKILKAIALRLQTIHKSDTQVFHFGSDEFIVFFGSTKNETKVKSQITSIGSLFASPIEIEGKSIPLTISSGVSLFPNDADDSETLIRNANNAMKFAKESGRNTFHFYDESLNKGAVRQYNIEKGMQEALQLKEFSLNYQPFINFKTGQIIGAEALVRWHSHKLGQVFPDEFIPIAEQTGFIDKLGEFVLRTACEQLAQWLPILETEFQMSINISPRQFRNKGFSALVMQVLKENNLNPAQIKLEVTEGLLLEKKYEPEKKMNELHLLGIALAMDDFGTGYSSLQNLRKFPFSLLKIDRSFIHELLDNKRDQIMIKAIIAMCKDMHLQVIAEGVETKEQSQYLKNIGCDLAQGYFFSKPVLSVEFEKLIRNKPFLLSVNPEPGC